MSRKTKIFHALKEILYLFNLLHYAYEIISCMNNIHHIHTCTHARIHIVLGYFLYWSKRVFQRIIKHFLFSTVSLIIIIKYMDFREFSTKKKGKDEKRGRRGEREDFCTTGHLIRMRPGLLNIKAPAVLTLLCVCARVFRGESHLSGRTLRFG